MILETIGEGKMVFKPIKSDSETIIIDYDTSVQTDVKTETYSYPDFSQEIELSDAVKNTIALNQKLYQTRYNLNRKDSNILPKVKLKKLDDKLYRGSASRTSVIKGSEQGSSKHRIRSIKF